MTGDAALDGRTAEHDRWFESPARRARQDVDQLVSLEPEVLTDASLWGRLRLLKYLRAALRTMRKQGVEEAWSYDLARHRRLLAAYGALAAAAVKREEKRGLSRASRS